MELEIPPETNYEHEFADMSKENKYWIAGLLEGEGAFMTGPPRDPNQITIDIHMIDKDIMERVAEIFGTSVYKRPKRENRQQIYRVQIYCSRAISLMKAIYPIMGERRKSQIEKVFKAWDPWKHKKANSKLNDEKAKEVFHLTQNTNKSYEEIAKSFPVSDKTVKKIAQRKTYQWVTRNL